MMKPWCEEGESALVWYFSRIISYQPLYCVVQETNFPRSTFGLQDSRAMRHSTSPRLLYLTLTLALGNSGGGFCRPGRGVWANLYDARHWVLTHMTRKTGRLGWGIEKKLELKYRLIVVPSWLIYLSPILCVPMETHITMKTGRLRWGIEEKLELKYRLIAIPSWLLYLSPIFCAPIITVRDIGVR